MTGKGKILAAIAAGILLITALIITYGSRLQFLAAFLRLSHNKESFQAASDNKYNKFYTSDFFELKKTILESFKSIELDKLDNNKASCQAQVGITSHHLPTALPFISSFYKQIASLAGPRETFVILGPDHFEKCQAPVVTSKLPYLTPFGELEIDEELADKILQSGVSIDENCFYTEHSVAAQTIFIKYLFPNAKIVPLLFSANVASGQIDNVVEVLAKYKNRITVIASVDFSHYQKRDRAIGIDRESEQMIENLDATFLDINHVDSPPAIRITILLARKFGAAKPEILSRANSFDFTQNAGNTTGYINAIFCCARGPEIVH